MRYGKKGSKGRVCVHRSVWLRSNGGRKWILTLKCQKSKHYHCLPSSLSSTEMGIVKYESGFTAEERGWVSNNSSIVPQCYIVGQTAFAYFVLFCLLCLFTHAATQNFIVCILYFHVKQWQILWTTGLTFIFISKFDQNFIITQFALNSQQCILVWTWCSIWMHSFLCCSTAEIWKMTNFVNFGHFFFSKFDHDVNIIQFAPNAQIGYWCGSEVGSEISASPPIISLKTHLYGLTVNCSY